MRRSGVSRSVFLSPNKEVRRKREADGSAYVASLLEASHRTRTFPSRR